MAEEHDTTAWLGKTSDLSATAKCCLLVAVRCHLWSIAGLAMVACGGSGGGDIDAGADADPDHPGPVAIAELLQDGLDFPAVAAVGDALYGSDSLAGELRIFALAKDGTAIATLTAGLTAAGPMHVTESELYWLWPGRHSADFMDGALYHLDRSSGVVTTVLTGLTLPTELIYGGASFFIVDHDGGRFLQVSPSGAIEEVLEDEGVGAGDVGAGWAAWSAPPGWLGMRSLEGDATREHAVPLLAYKVVIAGDEVFLASAFGAIHVVAAENGLVTEIDPGWPANQGGSVAMAADDRHLYWTNHVEGAILRLALDTHAVEIFSSVDEYPGSLVVDDDHVYWAEPYAGRIMRARKP